MKDDKSAKDTERVYKLCGDPYRFFITGTGVSDEQFLVVLQEPNFIVVRFDKRGGLLDMCVREMARSGAVDITEAFSETKDEALARFLNSVGFSPGPITAQQFFFDQYSIGIVDFPREFLRCITTPTNYSTDEIAIAREEQSRWAREGLYELWLGEHTNLWMKSTGERESS